jgi:hypothetical protein
MKELADHPGTEIHVAELALRKYNAIMEQYRLTETDLELRGQSAEGRSFKHSYNKKPHEVTFIAPAICELSQTDHCNNVAGTLGTITFFGLRADIDYAEWLYRLCFNAIEQSWEAYRKSPQYKAICLRDETSLQTISTTYRRAFAFKLADMISELANENKAKATGTDLVLVKSALIKSLMDEVVGEIKMGRAVSLSSNNDARLAAATAYYEAEKVRLRQEVAEETLQIEDHSA